MPRLLPSLRSTPKSEETAENKVPQVADPEKEMPKDSPAAEQAVPEQTDGRPDTPRAGHAAHARGRPTRRGRRTIWNAMFAIALLAVLATAVTLVLLQSAGIINWGFLGPIS